MGGVRCGAHGRCVWVACDAVHMDGAHGRRTVRMGSMRCGVVRIGGAHGQHVVLCAWAVRMDGAHGRCAWAASGEHELRVDLEQACTSKAKTSAGK